jgi:large subunit ribosomal protein L34
MLSCKPLTLQVVFGVIVGFPERLRELINHQTDGTAAGTPAFSVAAGSTMKRTYQASKTRRARTHGFLVRMKTRGGRAVINARRAKGRKRLAV